MSKLKALVVDDSFIMYRKITKIIENFGCEVKAYAKTGKEAIMKYKVEKPDFVTMDITMPDMNGIEATRQIIAYDPDAVIIMITSHGQELLVLDAIQAGAIGYVLKPLEEIKTGDAILAALQKVKLI